MALETRALHPLFGVEVLGLDLAPDLPGKTAIEILRLFEEHSLLLFRGQSLDSDRHLQIGGLFGPPLQATKNNATGGSYFSRQSNVDPETGAFIGEDDNRTRHMLANQLWHSDGSYREVPALCSLLYAYEVTEEGGATEYASMRAAWEALPEETRKRVEGLVAEHSLIHSRARVGGYRMTADQRAEAEPVRQALVRMNPANRRKSLFIGAHAANIEGLSEDESEALLAELMEFATQERFVYSHRWQVGDLLVYDNRCLLHRATPFDSARKRRLLQRVTVAGNERTVAA